MPVAPRARTFGKKKGLIRRTGIMAHRRQQTVTSRVMRSFTPRGPAAQRSGIGEVKALDVSTLTAAPGGVALAFNSTGSVIPLNLIATGSSIFNRIGRKVELQSVEFQTIIASLGVSRASPVDTVRIAIVYDRQANGALPAITDIFQDTEQNATNTTGAQSGLNLNNRDRFSVIMDRRFQLPQVTNTAGVLTNTWPNSFGGAGKPNDDGVGLIHEFRRLGGLLTHFKADSSPAVIGDVSTGTLLLVAFADLAAGTENFQGAEWHTRLRYTDV